MNKTGNHSKNQRTIQSMPTTHSHPMHATQSPRTFISLLLIFLLFSVLQPAPIALAKPASVPSTPVISIGVGTDFFTISNSINDMTVAYSYTLAQGSTVQKAGSFQLAAGSSLSVSFTGYGDFTLTIKDNNSVIIKSLTITIAGPTNTFTPSPVPTPILSATGVSVPGTGDATFTITNTGGDMPAAYSYAVKDSGGVVVKTGSFLLKAGESSPVNVYGVYGILTLDITDDKGTTFTAATVDVVSSTAVPTAAASTSTSTSLPTSTSKPKDVVAASETPVKLVWYWYTSTPTSTPTPTITVTPSPSPIPSTPTSTNTAAETATLQQIMTQTSTIQASIPVEEPRKANPLWVVLPVGTLLSGLIAFWFFRLRKV
jgi:hypothetical protein